MIKVKRQLFLVIRTTEFTKEHRNFFLTESYKIKYQKDLPNYLYEVTDDKLDHWINNTTGKVNFVKRASFLFSTTREMEFVNDKKQLQKNGCTYGLVSKIITD